MKIIAFLVFIAVLAVAVLGATAGQTAVNRYYDDKLQPDSAIDAVMASRQTPPVAPDSGRSWAGAGMLALVAVVVGGFVFTMRGGSEFLRQWRLARKRPSLPRRYPMPQTPTLPDYYAQQMDTLPRAQRPQELPQWTETDDPS